jgi:hypothetical protein
LKPSAASKGLNVALEEFPEFKAKCLGAASMGVRVFCVGTGIAVKKIEEEIYESI